MEFFIRDKLNKHHFYWLVSCIIIVQLTEDGSKKFAVVDWSAPATWVGMDLLPSAIPTMAVMCVSGPKTCSGIPRFLPTSRITLQD